MLRKVGLDATGEAELSPGLIHGGGRSVGEVHRAAGGDHRDADFFGDTWVRQVLSGKAAWFGAEK